MAEEAATSGRKVRSEAIVAAVLIVCVALVGFWEFMANRSRRPFDPFQLTASDFATFELPASWKGHVLKLRFDAVDDEAEVWLNGKRVGEHRKEGETDPNWWEEPSTFDLTSFLNWDRPNVLTVLVNDFALGGGIWKSVFVQWDDGPGMLSPQATTDSQTNK